MQLQQGIDGLELRPVPQPHRALSARYADAQERVLAPLELDDADPAPQTRVDAADQLPEHPGEQRRRWLLHK